jgi:SAM-dependent methyltransferase
VVTDVGDAAFIVGDTGWVVMPGDPEQLASAIEQAHAEWEASPKRWRKRREAARSRIAENFTIEAMVAAYEQVWRQVARGQSPISMAPASALQTLPDNVDPKTIAGFGREWEQFDQSKLVGEEYDDVFAGYFGIFPFEDLPPLAEGFDLGCGSGRWAAGVAPLVGKLHLIDPAEQALDVARKRLEGFGNVSFHLAPADAIPLPDGSQDFGYSLGVLHHIPDTARALADAVRKLKPGAPFLLYIYYKLENRPAWFRFLWRGSDAVRRIVSRLPFPVARGVTSVIAAIVYWPLARLALVAEKRGRDPSAIPLGAYHDRSFYTMRTDALDRFGTRLEQRFTRGQIEQMMRDAGLKQIRFSDQPPYWVACGIREQEPSTPTNSPKSDGVPACN